MVIFVDDDDDDDGGYTWFYIVAYSAIIRDYRPSSLGNPMKRSIWQVCDAVRRDRSRRMVNLDRCIPQWVGLRVILQESPIFHGKIHGLLQSFR